MDRIRFYKMIFLRSLCGGIFTNAWPAEINIPIVVALCSVTYARFGWISVIPSFVALEMLVLLLLEVRMRGYISPSQLIFSQFWRSKSKPQYSTYQLRSSQLCVPIKNLKNWALWRLYFHIFRDVIKVGPTMLHIAPLCMVPVRNFIHQVVFSTLPYFWNPAIFRSGGDVFISQSSRSRSREVDQFKNLEDYTYEPIESVQGFRILLLKGDTEESPLEGELIAQSTSTAAIFTALSYTWDNQPLDRHILCNGNKLAITANCEAALYRLRRRFRGRLIWVDAICINQKDRDEKAQQIPIMGLIYRHATEVIAWLGEGTAESEIGFKYLRLWMVITGSPWIPASLRRLLGNLVIQKILERGHQKYIMEIAQRPWFRRVWTLQEITMARLGYATLCCGKNETDFDLTVEPLIRLISFLTADSLRAYSDLVALRSALFLRVQMRSALHYGLTADPKILMQPSHILGQIRAYKATDKRDKIYALYALFQETGIKLPEPNYNTTSGEVYRQATISTMNYEQSLDILLLLSGKRIEGKPSWVPDFSELLSAGTFLLENLAAAGNSKAEFHILNKEVILSVRGYVIDEVCVAMDGLPWENTRLDMGSEDEHFLDLKQGFYQTVQILQLCLNFCYGNNGSRYAIEGDEDEVSSDVLSCGILKFLPSELGSRFWKEYQMIIRANGKKCRKELEVLLGLDKRGSMLWQRFFNDPKLKHLTEIDEWKIYFAIKTTKTLRIVHQFILTMLSGKKIFWTKSGYLGQGSAELHSGDIIALIQGLRMPMILRPRPSDSRPNQYSVVSPAYISGMMQGELWEGGQYNLSRILLE